MGLSPDMTTSGTLVAPKPKGIIDPSTGKPIGSNDAFFGEINNELADKGFLVTSTDELINWARTGSDRHPRPEHGQARGLAGSVLPGPQQRARRQGLHRHGGR